MKADELSPEKSLELITQVINQARNRFEENGFIYMFWGALIALASLSQFALIKNEYFDISWYPYLLMPLGGIFSGFYFSKKKEGKGPNQIGNILSIAWAVLSINILILCFIFHSNLKVNLIPIVLIFLSVGIIISGVSIKSKLLLFSGLLINASAFVCFKLDWLYHPLLMGIVSIVAILIPGILLMTQNKKQQSV